MKTLEMDSTEVTLKKALRQARRGEIVFLTIRGNTKFVVAPADNDDREICALRSNQEFLDHLTQLEKEAHSRPMKSLEEVRARYKKHK